MKKIVTRSIALAAIIIFSTTGAYPGKPAGSTHPVPTNETGKVNYRVQVLTSAPTSYPTCHFFVVVTDETNRAVSPPQAYVPGNVTYYFSEEGPVSGTRIARLRSGYEISDCAFYAEPAENTGTFANNAVIHFTLNATNNLPK